MKKILAALVVVAIAAAFLGFTSPGHRLLASLGFATADCSGSAC